jgi:hypothetical protein
MTVWDETAAGRERPGVSRGVGFLKIMVKSALFGGLFGLVCAIVFMLIR